MNVPYRSVYVNVSYTIKLYHLYDIRFVLRSKLFLPNWTLEESLQIRIYEFRYNDDDDAVALKNWPPNFIIIIICCEQS